MTPTRPLLPTLPVDRQALRLQLAQLCLTKGVTSQTTQPSGFAELDAHLPGGGWPVGALTECLLDTHGIGELSLWMPTLREIAQSKRHLAFVTPPFLPYAPALVQQGIPLAQVQLIVCQTTAESLWATEQVLRCAAFGAVFAWPHDITDKQLRRLQLAAESGRNIGVLYRPLAATQDASPAALRLKLQVDAKMQDQTQLRIVIHKCRGGRSGISVRCTIGTTLQAAS